MSYTFEAAPRVVSNTRDKYRDTGNAGPTNIMHDKRIFRGNVHNLTNLRKAMTPAEQDDARVTREKEERQEEMLKTQLAQFKKSKLKQTPYDIKPAATARIEVDLNYFLTDQKDLKPLEAEVACEADEFLPKPPSPKYIPKKTGIDVSTQIWDTDLFSFNREVQPILNVLVNKTLEQAKLEVEEDHELEAMRIYKEKNAQRKKEEDGHWNEMLKREIELIQEKEKIAREARARAAAREMLTKKIINLHLSKQYLLYLESNSMDTAYESGVFPDYRDQQIQVILTEYYSRSSSRNLRQDKEQATILDELVQKCTNDILKSRQAPIAAYKKKIAFSEVLKINESKNSRNIRFLMINPEYRPVSELLRRVECLFNGQRYDPPQSDRDMVNPPNLEEVEEGSQAPDLGDPMQENKGPEAPKYLTVNVDDFEKFVLSFANNVYIDTPKDKRKYMLHADFMSETGEQLYTLNSNEKSSIAGVKHDVNARDIRSQRSIDEKLVVSLKKIPEEVHHIVFYIIQGNKEATQPQKYNKYTISDGKTAQIIDQGSVPEKSYEDESSQMIMAYRLYRQEYDPRGMTVKNNMPISTPVADLEFDIDFPERVQPWHLDIFNIQTTKPVENVREQVRFAMAEGYEYTQEFIDQLRAFKDQALRDQISAAQATTKRSKKKGKPDTSKQNSSRSALAQPEENKDEDEEKPIIPTRTYGPFMLRDCKYCPVSEIMDLVEDQVEGFVQREIFTEGMCIRVKGKELQEGKLLFTAKSLADIQLANKDPPPPPPPVEEENEEEENQEQ